MGLKNKSLLNVESINYQKGGMLFKELVLCIEGLKALGEPTLEQFSNCGINDIIRKHTGIDMRILMETRFFKRMDAYIYPPGLNFANLMYNPFGEHGTDSFLVRDGHALLRNTKPADLVGYVDRKKGKLSGIFTKIPVNMVIGSTFFSGKSKFTAEETAGIILHETGHAFGIFDYCARLASANIAMESRVREALNCDNFNSSVEVLSGAYREFKCNDKTLHEAVAKGKDLDDLVQVMVSDVLVNAPSLSGSPFYDQVNFEAYADEFATKHGAGLHTITALDKMWAGPLATTMNSIIMFAAFLACFPGLVSSLMTGVPMVALLCLTKILGYIIPIADVYDDNKTRAARVSQTLIAELKKTNKDDPKLIEMIEGVSKLLEISDKHAKGLKKIMLYVQLWVSGIKNGEMALAEYQKKAETLTNNRLFLSAAKLKNLQTNS